MARTEHLLFLSLILGWITLIALGITLHYLVNLLPLVAVLILANRLNRREPVCPPSAERTAPKAMAAD